MKEQTSSKQLCEDSPEVHTCISLHKASKLHETTNYARAHTLISVLNIIIMGFLVLDRTPCTVYYKGP